MTILRRLFPRSIGIFGMFAAWKAIADDPVLLCACQDGEWWCESCEPVPGENYTSA